MPDINDPKIGDDGLTMKQRLFALYYVELLNGTKAAVKAGYSTTGAHVEASRLLNNAKVKAAIEKHFTAIHLSKAEVIGRIAQIARADIANYLRAHEVLNNGQMVTRWFIDIDKIVRDGNSALIKSIKRTKYGTEVELHDQLRALELIGKSQRLFADVVITEPQPDATANELDDKALTAIAKEAIEE